MIGMLMNTLATTKMSSKGQVVIPEEIRNALHLKAGTKFVVIGEGDVVVLKTITPPHSSEFKEMILKAREIAYEAGMTPEDVEKAISEVRSGKANRS
ncbi:AbrB family transcriptional regulator [Candidatus Fermentibacteria bacterium]|nr:MAG: AbrB family transcriptional regulator [Candidatus Fermentibacteria bacterium]PIE53703.1 MAG: AbrB family transcriptional regulator [Candidatus Fermentibacteria bacterium]